MCMLSHFSHFWLFCNPMDCSPPGSSVHGIFQAGILEWVVMPISRLSSWPMNRTSVSCIDRKVLYHQCHLAYIPWNKPQCPDAGEWGDPGWKTYSSERGSFSGHDPGKWQKVQQKREILSRNLSWHIGGRLSEFSRSLILRDLVWVYVGIRARIVCGSRWGWGPDSNQILKVQIGIRTF